MSIVCYERITIFTIPSISMRQFPPAWQTCLTALSSITSCNASPGFQVHKMHSPPGAGTDKDV
jgi:hypothetical protein